MRGGSSLGRGRKKDEERMSRTVPFSSVLRLATAFETRLFLSLSLERFSSPVRAVPSTPIRLSFLIFFLVVSLPRRFTSSVPRPAIPLSRRRRTRGKRSRWNERLEFSDRPGVQCVIVEVPISGIRYTPQLMTRITASRLIHR